MEYFELISLSIAENEKTWGEGVESEGLRDYGGKSVNGLAHICGIAGKVDVVTKI